MHIILAFLGTIVTILVLINRLSDAGIDIGWLNPFTWRRRRAWRKKYQGDPIFKLSEPLEVASLLATTIAKIDGEISKQEKEVLLALFQSEFGKTEKEASDLLMSSVFLFGKGDDAVAKPDKVMRESLEKFTEAQARSVVSLLESISKIDTSNANEKLQFLNKVKLTFDKHVNSNEKW